MSDKNYIRLWLLLLSLLTAGALLYSVRDMLPPIAFWLVIVGLGCLGLTILYYLHKLYTRFRANHIAMQRQKEDLEAQRQQRQIEAERWQVERAALLLGQHLQVTRIFPDSKGYLPTIVNITETDGYQYVNLPHPAHMGKLSAGQQVPAIGQHAESLQDQIPTTIRYEEIRGQIPRGRSCLGVSENGVEHCDFGQLMTMWICGGSSTGKSNTVALKIDEAIRNGRKIKIILVDPHARKDDSLYKKIQGYESYFLCRVAVNEPEILAALTWFKDEFERRLELGGQGQTDILLVVDEVSNVVESDDPEIGKLIKKIARICGQESRGFGMFGWFISQDAAGLAWLRKRAMTVIAHKLNMMSERKLACNEDAEIAREMDSWPRGRVAVYGLNFQGVMVAQMPVFSPPVVEADTGSGAIDEQEDDEMEELQRLPPALPNSAGKMREDRQENNGEARGRSITEEELNNPLLLKKFLNEAGKMRTQGMSIDAILKAFDLPPGGRNNQNLKALLDAQDQDEQNEAAGGRS